MNYMRKTEIQYVRSLMDEGQFGWTGGGWISVFSLVLWKDTLAKESSYKTSSHILAFSEIIWPN